jgi:hypothetical protein
VPPETLLSALCSCACALERCRVALMATTSPKAGEPSVGVAPADTALLSLASSLHDTCLPSLLCCF